jgi:hypothetical protein
LSDGEYLTEYEDNNSGLHNFSVPGALSFCMSKLLPAALIKIHLVEVLGKGFRPHHDKKPDTETAARRW